MEEFVHPVIKTVIIIMGLTRDPRVNCLLNLQQTLMKSSSGMLVSLPTIYVL